jgi:hypothetical protein
MKNYLTEHILEYRYKTNAYIALLCESHYFDPHISDFCREDILKRITELSNAVCEGRVHYPHALVKKYHLHEQVPGVSSSISKALKAVEAAKVAREAKAAAEAAEVAKATAKAAEAATKTTEATKPVRPAILPAQSGVQPITPIRGQALEAQAMDYIQMQAIQHAQQGLRGEDLANVVRETLKNNPKFAELGQNAERVEKSAEQILKNAEETANKIAKGEQISGISTWEYGGTRLTPEEGNFSREDILTMGASLRGSRSSLENQRRNALIDLQAEPRVNWQGSEGLPQTEIRSYIDAAEREALKTRKAGEEALRRIAPESENVSNKVKDLVYELNRRKAQGEVFTPEEQQSYQKMLDDLKKLRETQNASK